ncbi:NAD-dependent epimerase/dehydratase family protein [Thalassobaculum sp. OXR-137]|uniref:NAD-dependent epimerase/dehydratase family protein n=1 Tax=Thalassobaculum sp. OXR-137 TaxID=3100173 RepID=UPI002AC998F0|nr:NAD-dependent epimerase/dehydratase family protein [Thalassobaculum sp. OXR-137]WPZ33494.1 NAD-dependent epimerase/dehydratase family protein [Thalassobaculum sp. OXR-137]
MRILVTGGCGFIGSHVVDALLAAGHEPVVLDDLSTGRRANVPSGVEIVEGSVEDSDAVAQAIHGCGAVVHLAAIASVQKCNETWAESHAVNVTGTVKVLEAARDAGRIPVVYASSAAIYGDNANTPLSEREAPAPLTAYGVDKYGSELHAGVAGRIHGVPSFGLRFFNVFGPRQDPSSPYSGVISIFASRFAKGQGVSIHGDGGQVRDFVYVGDVVAHILAALKAADTTAPVANVCTGAPTTVLGLAETLRAMTGNRGDIVFGPARAGDIRVSIGDPAVAVRRMGIRADVSLEEGLRRLLSADYAVDLPH